MNSKSSLLLLSALVCCLGCNDPQQDYTAAVQGHVTIDGELAHRGTVNFYPDGNGPVATGRIHEDGSYSLRVGAGNIENPDAAKIAPGKYTVTVVVRAAPDYSNPIAEGGPPAAGPKLTSLKYANAETSDLVFEIKSGANIIPLDLEGASADITENESESSNEDEALEEKEGKDTSSNNTPVVTGESPEEGTPE